MKLVSRTHTQRHKTKDGLEYIPPGEPFECPDKIAREKIAAKRAEPFLARGEESPSQRPDNRGDRIAEAILSLDENNADLWNQDGSPKLDEVRKAANDPSVTREEALAVWAEISQADSE